MALQKLKPGINDLKTKFPEIAEEADGWNPSSFSTGSEKKCPGNVVRDILGKQKSAIELLVIIVLIAQDILY